MDKAGYGCLGLIALFLIIALIGPAEHEDNRSQFAAEKAAMLAKIETEGGVDQPVLSCAASKVSSATAETVYLLWLHQRGDLTTEAQRNSAASDTISSIESCGGNMGALVREMKASDDAVFKGFVLALLEAGR